jgi:HrpA-like RNA helicase
MAGDWNRFSADTLLVATEGVLTARLESDPLLSDFLPSFSTSFTSDRSTPISTRAHASGLARTPDLAIVVMSATDAERRCVSRRLPDRCSSGRIHPVEISYRPDVAIEQAIRDARPHSSGALLCFLPGAPEIRRAAERLDFPVFALHGGLESDEQDAALRPLAEPRVILATNIAETTLTVPDVVGVIDSGLQKTAGFDAGRGIDSLEVERVSQDSADQRAGRAGRLRPGFAIRLWDSRDRLRPHADPEIRRVDLASTCLSVLAWGGHPRTLEWFDRPADDAMDAALALLARLDAIDSGGRLTPLGRDLQHLPLHPRLGRILTAARGAPAAARACALLSERHFTPIPRDRSVTVCDLLAAVDRDSMLPPHVVRARDQRYLRAHDEYETRRTHDDVVSPRCSRAIPIAPGVARRRPIGCCSRGTGAPSDARAASSTRSSSSRSTSPRASSLTGRSSDSQPASKRTGRADSDDGASRARQRRRSRVAVDRA